VCGTWVYLRGVSVAQLPDAAAPLRAARYPRISPSVAIVHDYLCQYGGAERVVLELSRAWPNAPIFTSLYRPESTFPEFSSREILVTPLDMVGDEESFRTLAPLYPMAFRSLGTLDQDVVISSSSGWAHSVRTAPDTLHIVYCHTPARWLYRPEHHLDASLRTRAMGAIRGSLVRWDQGAARRANVYVANCENVRNRIRREYGRDAEVLHPPVDTDRFTPRPRGERLLVVSRLLPYKRVDLVVRAASAARIGLDVVGTGPSMESLRQLAGPTVEFHGKVEDDALTELFEGCRALCLAGTEDFGITPLEAHAAGKPVVAFREGGALETVREGLSGTFFDELTVDSLLAAIRASDELESSPAEVAAVAQSFSAPAFRERARQLVLRLLAARDGSQRAA
jgi:glycosyltransferase involved in cell wall biosynthesis